MNMLNLFLQHVRRMLERLSLSVPDPRPRGRVVELGLGLLCGEVPKTITSALHWNGLHGDWSANYRLFSKTEWRQEELFSPILADSVGSGTGPIYGAMDDTLIRKTGRKIPGTAYARDPLSPPFRANLVLGQRFLQTAVMARAGEDRPWRAIPVGFLHAPPLKAAPRATPEEKRAVKEARKKHNMSIVGCDELTRLRARIDCLSGGFGRQLIMTADGSFANRCFLRGLPERTTAVVRIRRDASLRMRLSEPERTGNRKYGKSLPTPEQMLTDDEIPVQAAGIKIGERTHIIKYKVIHDVCWPKTTADRPVTVVLIKPLGYRLQKTGKLLYKQPAYLLVAGAAADLQHILQAYLLRWQIEVSFRDEKTILGAGKAQVWSARSVERAPAFLVACYAALLLASISALDDKRNEQFEPLAPWRQNSVTRPSARDLVRLLRTQAMEEQKHRDEELMKAA
jgi:hypothetical protein